MTVEELLVPRYKVIADWPDSPFCIGDIRYAEDRPYNGMSKEYYDKYPHLFQGLEWWEERSDGDMPQYAKTPAGNSVRKIESINTQWGTLVFVGGKVRKIKQWLPATEEEFQKYTNGL